MSNRKVSIIIVTCNRAPALKETLHAFETVKVPNGWDVEFIVVDNVSTDDTANVVRRARLSNAALHYLFEPRKGKGYGLNSALAVAQGEVLLFTDDDIRPATDWIERIATPLFQGEADAVGGKILLAPHLLRPWLGPSYKAWLAWLEQPPPGRPFELIGANMGFGRHVLEKVPAFDPELAPGAIGLGEDTLFGWQLLEAGFRIRFLPEAVVVHHPDISRLKRSAWLRMGEIHGRKEAYLRYHWKHEDMRAPRLKREWLRLKLLVRRILQPPAAMEDEGCARWEMSYVGDMAWCEQFCRERLRARNYSLRGLVKRSQNNAPAATTAGRN